NPAKGIVFHPYFSRIKSDNPAQYIDRSTNNPVIKQLLHAVNNLIISLQKKHRTIDEVRIEFARSFKMSEEDKESYERLTKKKRKDRKQAMKELLNNNIIPTNDMITRYLLWKEQREECPYTGKKISFEQAFSSATEIDHIYPYSASMDNSFVNKVLVFTEANQQKGKRTPFEWKGNDPNEWDTFKKIVSKIYLEGPVRNIEKYKRLTARKTTEDVSQEWQNRQLTDTAYIAKLTRRVLEELHGLKVEPVRASATAVIRRHLGLNSVLAPKIRIPKEIVEKFIQLFPDSNRFWAVIKNSDKSIIAFSGSKSEKIPKDKNDKWYEPTNAEESNGVKLDEILKDLEPFTFDVISGAINSREDGEFFINPEKERSDHLHHFVDAVAIALNTPAIRQAIHNEMEERLSKKLEPIKKDIIKQVREFESLILVIHRRKRHLPITPAIRRNVRTGRKKSAKIKKPIITKAPRGALHEATFYGKIKTGKLLQNKYVSSKQFDDLLKKFKNSKKDSKNAHQKLKTLKDKIVYKKVFNVLQEVDSGNTKAMLDGGIVRHARVLAHHTPNKQYKPPYYNSKGYVITKNNWYTEIFKDANGNLRFNVISLWDAVERQKEGKLFNPNAFMYIYRNDMFLLYFPEPELESEEEYKNYIAKMQDILNKEQVIDRSKYPNIYRFVSRHIFRLQKMDVKKRLYFRMHREATLNMPENVFPCAASITSVRAYINTLPYRIEIDRTGQIIKLERAF
ncbi:MAG: type II CRISPR RNA-guided endonuclease Cas9, partial [Chlorobi bacterium]|nr:type II CRISPR RNA-guided endonuclease Cas9 [Chlorobiota bacterium]